MLAQTVGPHMPADVAGLPVRLLTTRSTWALSPRQSAPRAECPTTSTTRNCSTSWPLPSTGAPRPRAR
eukprot:5106590-Pyramimonas_sp.AAC.1